MRDSSPVVYPSSPPSPGRPKRGRDDDTFRPADVPESGTRKKIGYTTSGFVIDDGSGSDSDTEMILGPQPKKRMLNAPSATIATPRIPALDRPTSHDNASSIRLPFEDLQNIDTQEMEANIDTQKSYMFTDDGPVTLPIFEASLFQDTGKLYDIRFCSGRKGVIRQRLRSAPVPYEELVAARSKTKEGRAVRSHYGINVHELIRNAQAEIKAQRIITEQEKEKEAGSQVHNMGSILVESVEADNPANSKRPKKHTLWSEKYRARKFLDLCGDDTKNRHVLRWLKGWDPIVFPGSIKPKSKRTYQQEEDEEKPLRKILMLTGPPGLGKTTLAHVCAKQAGYDVLEINASDDRGKDVVKGRIRTSLGTETVKTVSNTRSGDGRPKVARPLCVIVDEVDGVTTGSGVSGEGGFIRALMDLMLLDQKNSKPQHSLSSNDSKKKTEKFRQMRPLVLICNDVYHPSLRPLRQSNMAEIIHVGKPTVEHVVNRLQFIFQKEGISCERDAARKLCEAAWGMASGIEVKRGVESAIEGDLRGVMIISQWVGSRFMAQTLGSRNKVLSRTWLERNVLEELSKGIGGGRGTGRGSVRDVVTRVFQEGAGFPKPALGQTQSRQDLHGQPTSQLGFAEFHKKHGMAQLQHIIETSGDVDRIMTDIFTEYPNREYTDDCYLSKPNEAYEWMHFFDKCSSRLFGEQDWELIPYLSQPVLACHSLFSAPIRQASNNYGRRNDRENDNTESAIPSAFSGPRAAFLAHEAEKQNRSILQAVQAELPPILMRAFRSSEDVATEFLPYLMRLIAPDVHPVIIHGGGDQRTMASVRKESEKIMVSRAAEVMADVGLRLQKGKIENDMVKASQWVYRLEPDLDELAVYKTLTDKSATFLAPTRYAVRQVLDQELAKVIRARETAARQARFQNGGSEEYAFEEMQVPTSVCRAGTRPDNTKVKRDFFGRVIAERPKAEGQAGEKKENTVDVWVRYNEGLNNAVRKPVSVADFLKGL
ncbi:Chromosome transmission fidelity protein 18 [Ceratocystis pirilliformis]|uniref:Chromosome transmission fidelity protein 18 n=1 Tax=Ceratocystis pirilliformis TaxID=259994 RepID=A0ABR3ZIT7_9PEZI